MKKTALLFLGLAALVSIAFVKPTSIEPKSITVIIDAGHGGSDFGAKSNDHFEKNIVQQIAQKIKQNNQNKNINIILSRDSDTLITLKDRTDYFNSINPDMVLSLHINANPNSEKSGLESYVSDKSTFYEKSNTLANQLNASLGKNTSLKVGETKIAPFYILKNTKAPSILLELGYMTNKNDLDYLTNEEEQNKIANTINAFLSELK
jgi:N-acetylmuramoyl-L-alanine amidase